jgi:hypothetical protein
MAAVSRLSAVSGLSAGSRFSFNSRSVRQLGPHDPRGRVAATEPLHPAAPRHLIEQQGGGHRSIEAGGCSAEGNAHQLIAVLAGEHRQAITLRTGHDHQRTIEIHLLQAHRALSRQAHHPVALLLEAVEGAVQIHHPGHRQMLQGTGSHLGHRAGEASAPALGQHQSMGSERFSAAGNGSKVVGVGDAIESHQQRRFTQVAAALDQARQIEGVGGGGLKHDALVHGAVGELTKAGPGDLLHQHPRGLGFPQKLQKGGTEAHFCGAPDAMHRATALQGRLGHMAPPEQIAGWTLIRMHPLGRIERFALHNHRRTTEAGGEQTARAALIPAGTAAGITRAFSYAAAGLPAAIATVVAAAIPLTARGAVAIRAPVTA